ncbi:MAG: hypothetical protein Q8O67_26100 [Deltaproteobacteria bacterium]|nr:hypothetical protein [Deltaproteobacteria bacterium]
MNDAAADVMEPTLWKKVGWIARVIKNDDDEGWAVEMMRMGDSEPALVGPWVMGRDKKNPKPLNAKDFGTLVKTASEVLERHVQHARAQTHKTITISADDGTRVRVDVDVVEDEHDPHALATCFDDATGAQLSQRRVAASFKLNSGSASELLKKG